MLANLFITMSAIETGTKLVASKPGASRAKNFTSLFEGNTNSTGSGKITTTDNKKLTTSDGLVNKQPYNFGRNLDKKTVDKMSPETQARKKSEIQTQSSIMFSGMQSAVLLTVQELPTAGAKSDTDGLTKVKNQFQQQVGSVNPGKLAQFIAGNKIVSLPQITRPEVLKAENKPLFTTIQDGRVKSETTSQDISNKSNIIPTQSEKGKDTGKPQLSDKAPVTVEKPASQENGKESLHEILSVDSKGDFAGGTPVVSDNSKIQLPNNILAALQNHVPHSQQKVLINQQKLSHISQETTIDGIETDHKELLSKLSSVELQIKGRGQPENQSLKSGSQKIAQSQVQLSAAQAENHNDSPPSHVSNQDVETGVKAFFSTDSYPAIREQASAVSDFANSTANADFAANIREQIEGTIQSSFSSGNQQIIIRLNPPELGRVAVRFQEQSDNVAGIIHVEKPQTKEQIQQAIPEIIQNLQNSGIQIKTIEVVLTNQQGHHVPHDQSSGGQNNWSGQQNPSNPEPQRNTYNEFMTNVDGVAEIREGHANFFEGSINILI